MRNWENEGVEWYYPLSSKGLLAPVRLLRKSVWEDWKLSDSTNDQSLDAIEGNNQVNVNY